MYNLSVICPDPAMGSFTILSEPGNQPSLENPGLQTMLVELTGPDTSTVKFSWLKFQPESPASALSGSRFLTEPPCDHPCPGLGCISAPLWCDGHPDCPGGWDEKQPSCVPLTPVKLLLGLSVAGVVFFTITAAILVSRLRVCSKKAASEPLPPCKRASNGTVETMLNHKENIQ